jgi:membrane fusion protein (multidrug efflux system)
MSKKSILISIIGLGIVAFAVFKFTNGGEKASKGKDKTPKRVDAIVVNYSTLTNGISVSGALVASEEVDLKNEVSGRIVKLNLPEGKSVSKGALLVKLFDDDLQATLKKLQAQLAIQSQIYKRQSELLKVNGISQNEYDQTGMQIAVLKADIEAQKAQIRKTEVCAPFAGIIGLKKVSVGAVVTNATSLATIRESASIKLDFYVPERYGSKIENGMNVVFKVANNDKEYEAKVIASERGINSEARSLKVRALVSGKSSELIPGAFATVNLEFGENETAIMIPSQALIPTAKGKTAIVARNGKAHIVEVKTGVREAANIEIIEGVKVGDTLITSGLMFLKEKSKLVYSSIGGK